MPEKMAKKSQNNAQIVLDSQNNAPLVPENVVLFQVKTGRTDSCIMSAYQQLNKTKTA